MWQGLHAPLANAFPANFYVFKFNNRNNNKRSDKCTKLTHSQWRRSGVFIVNFKHISHLAVFLFLTSNK